MPRKPGQQQLGTLPRFGLVVGIVAVLALLSGLGAMLGNGDRVPEGPSEVLYPDPPKTVEDMRLISADQTDVRLSDFQGQPVLLFFGYTHCPDVCPTTLAEFRRIKEALGEDGERARFVFVSVDGSRDTPEVVERYVKQFDEQFVGLTGSEDELRSVASDFYLYFDRSSGASAGGYLVDHTAYTYLIDAGGRLAAVYPFDTSIDLIAGDLQARLDR